MNDADKVVYGAAIIFLIVMITWLTWVVWFL